MSTRTPCCCHLPPPTLLSPWLPVTGLPRRPANSWSDASLPSLLHFSQLPPISHICLFLPIATLQGSQPGLRTAILVPHPSPEAVHRKQASVPSVPRLPRPPPFHPGFKWPQVLPPQTQLIICSLACSTLHVLLNELKDGGGVSPLLVGGNGRVIHVPWRGAHPTEVKQLALQMSSSPTASPLGCGSGRQGEWTEIRAALWEYGAQKQHRRSGRDRQDSEVRRKELCLPVHSQRVP